ncbi:tRNA pseudouridine(38-40) synthase TruA [Crassaminicella profunda]|uniref:tRNA pseudouridine(38-40) synthase TruA n=1 Tax=Crassaminicella profunda TaxID=1286698 RepID=UPI001CA72249|nr:tRNA pseudouridine(38-40) synthase TruA [Crassaminicella profunda]QZY54593.1 tRNA pseudouridine(38-40) synthase TruA [Crassaminicella profunda]
MKNVKLTIQYDGTNFSGWQIQPNARTVQEEIEKALTKIMKKPIKINGSGRTDAGVHAMGQIANFYEEFTMPIEKIPIALNALLPQDISIREAVEVPRDFHARYNAKGKKYIYKIYNNKIRNPLLFNYTYFVTYDLDLEKMKEATNYFIGEHNFKSFMASGSSIVNTVRTIHELNLYEKDELLILEAKGNGFLYNMVRIIAGTLVDVGRGKIKLKDLPVIIKSCKREKAGHTAPPQGLYLAKVFYQS